MKRIVLGLLLTVLLAMPSVANAQENGLLYFPFEEGKGDTAVDGFGNGNDGKISGNAKWVASLEKFGKALQFDGSVVVTAPHIPFDNRSFTVMMWINPVNDKRQEFFTQTQQGATNLSMHFRLGGPAGRDAPVNGIRYGFYGNDLNSSQNIIKANTWCHLTFWYNLEKKGKPIRRLYVNGELDVEDSGGPYQGKIGDTVLGKWVDVDPGWPFKGILDDVRIYDRPVTENEIKNAMAGPVGSAVHPKEKLTTTWGRIKNGE